MPKSHWTGLRVKHAKLEQWNFSTDVIDFERMNIFIGPNNAGKSRLLRLLFSDMAYHHVFFKATPVDSPRIKDYTETNSIVNKYSDPRVSEATDKRDASGQTLCEHQGERSTRHEPVPGLLSP